MSWSLWSHDGWPSWGWTWEIPPEPQQTTLLFLCPYCVSESLRKNRVTMKWNGDIISLQTTVDKRGQMSEIGVMVCGTAQDEQLLKSETNCLCSSLGRLCSFSCCPGPWIRFWYSLGTSSGLRVSSETHRVAKGKSRGGERRQAESGMSCEWYPLICKIEFWVGAPVREAGKWSGGPGHRYLVLRWVCGPRG